jgi:hypothetical protein
VIKTKAEFCSLLCQLAPEDAFFEMLANTNLAPIAACRIPASRLKWNACSPPLHRLTQLRHPRLDSGETTSGLPGRVSRKILR